MLDAENIDIVQMLDVFPHAAFQGFGHLEIQQILPGNFFGDFIAGHGNHAIADHRTASGHGDVGRPGAHIHQYQIQMSHRRRNKHVDGGDRLQGQGADFQTGVQDGRLQRVDDLTRQKGGDDFHRSFMATLAHESFQVGAIERELHDAVTDAVITGRIVDHPRSSQLLLGGLNGGQFQRPFFLRRQIASVVHIQLRRRVERRQGATGRSDGDLAERAEILLQLQFD